MSYLNSLEEQQKGVKTVLSTHFSVTYMSGMEEILKWLSKFCCFHMKIFFRKPWIVISFRCFKTSEGPENKLPDL